MPEIKISLLDDNGRPMNIGKKSINTVPFSFQYIVEA
jgi:hypothetical protein